VSIKSVLSPSWGLVTIASLCQDVTKLKWEEPAAKPIECPCKLQIKNKPAHKRPICTTTEQWPPEVCIIYPLSSSDLKLTDQHGAFQAETKYVLWTDAYLPGESCTVLTQEWLYNAAKEKGLKAIKMQVREDEEFI
jgi:hypothetical protein